MSSFGGSGGSIGGGSIGAVGNSTVTPTDNDQDLTHCRGRIDDIARHLNVLRNKVNVSNMQVVSSNVDEIDELVEKTLNLVL